jgi:hypothetical protein
VISRKSTATRYAQHVFLHLVGSTSHIVHSSVSGERNVNALFSCSGGPSAVSIKIAPGHITSNLCFCFRWDLPVTLCILVRLDCETSTHYFSCSGGTGTDSTKSAPGHVTMNLCFCIRWDLRVTWYILLHPGCETSTQYFSFSGGPGAVSIKSASGHVTPNLCFCIRWDLLVMLCI